MSKPLHTVLVTGATGQQGGAVVQELLHTGRSVRALTRKPDSLAAAKLKNLGAEVVGGDMEDGSSMDAVARGADAVFIVTTPYESGVESELRQAITAADTAKRCGVQHLVYSSVPEAQAHTGIPYFECKATIERHIHSLGVPYTILAPSFFMENLSSSYYLPGLHEGRFAIPLSPACKLQMICLADIASFTALVLEQRDRFGGQRIDLASDELTPPEIANVLSHVTARNIKHYRTPMSEIKSWSKDLAMVFEWLDRVGTGIDIASLRREYPEIAWHRLERWADSRPWALLTRSAAS